MTARLSAEAFSVKVDLVRTDRPTAQGRPAELALAHAGAGRGRTGRPHVEGFAAFGVSHAGDWTAYLVASRKYVGIDLELTDRPDLAGLERRLGLALAGTDEIETDFLTRWVVKEACLKAVGLGLLQTLRHVRLRAMRRSDAGAGDVRLFAASIGRIGMTAMALDLGFARLAIAFQDRYEPPEIQLLIDGCPSSHFIQGARQC